MFTISDEWNATHNRASVVTPLVPNINDQRALRFPLTALNGAQWPAMRLKMKVTEFFSHQDKWSSHSSHW